MKTQVEMRIEYLEWAVKTLSARIVRMLEESGQIDEDLEGIFNYDSPRSIDEEHEDDDQT